MFLPISTKGHHFIKTSPFRERTVCLFFFSIKNRISSTPFSLQVAGKDPLGSDLLIIYHKGDKRDAGERAPFISSDQRPQSPKELFSLEGVNKEYLEAVAGRLKPLTKWRRRWHH